MKKLYNLQQKIGMIALLLSMGTSMMWAQNQLTVEVWDNNNQPVANYPVWVKVGAPINLTLSGTTDAGGAFHDSVPNLTGSTVFTFMTYDCQGNRILSVKTFNSSNWLVDTLIAGCQTPKPGLNPFFSPSGSSLNISFLGFAGAWAMPGGIDIFYTWDFGDGSGGGGEMTSHTYAQAGSYNTCLTVGVYDSIFDIFPFNEVSCSTVVAGNSSTSCQAYYNVNQNAVSTAFTFSDSSFTSNIPPNGTVRQYWDFGDGTSDSGAVVTHYYLTPGTYYVCMEVRVFDSQMNVVCSDTYCDSVNYASTNPFCDVTLITTPDSLTPGLYNFQNNYVRGGGLQIDSSHTTFDYGDGQSLTLRGTGFTVQYTYQTSGTYVACVTNAYYFQGNLTCTDTDCDTLNVQLPPGPFCQASYIVDTVNSLGGNVYIWNTATPAYNDPAYNTSFTWDFGDGSSSNQAFPTHNYANPGVYGVCLTITSADSASNICTDTHCDTLGVDSLGHLIYKNATGFTLNVLDPNSIGLEETEISTLGIYPNPAGDFVKVNMARLNGELSWSIRDLKGSLLKSGVTGPGEDYSIDVTSLRPGLYIISLEQEEFPLSHQKLMIER